MNDNSLIGKILVGIIDITFVIIYSIHIAKNIYDWNVETALIFSAVFGLILFVFSFQDFIGMFIRVFFCCMWVLTAEVGIEYIPNLKAEIDSNSSMHWLLRCIIFFFALLIHIAAIRRNSRVKEYADNESNSPRDKSLIEYDDENEDADKNRRYKYEYKYKYKYQYARPGYEDDKYDDYEEDDEEYDEEDLDEYDDDEYDEEDSDEYDDDEYDEEDLDEYDDEEYDEEDLDEYDDEYDEEDSDEYDDDYYGSYEEYDEEEELKRDVKKKRKNKESVFDRLRSRLFDELEEEKRSLESNGKTSKDSDKREADNNSYASGQDMASRLFIGCNDRASLVSRYRSLMKTYHPDSGNGDVAMSQMIQEKYKELLKQYDA